MINIVLYEPEIPQNTGNIMRTCVGTNVKLHLIEPLGFKIDDTKLRRSAVDYYDYINYETYKNWDEFIKKNKGDFYFLTRYGKKSYHHVKFNEANKDIYLVFGKESTGIDKKILANHLENCLRIPTTDKVRSLNLSNTVAIVLFEVLRQFDFNGLIDHEPDTLKGTDFLDQFKGE
ncbi:Putative tRNA (cytidine/uridine-2\'-O-)-methyltransferase [Alteracholeplasma palmae J233]|uniref:Putative tRNA (cytidine(34)-2'-O)-methyltransferase n=1 Tax=Alteracholeplasma palmae (strain ATCC 49389 / J233) TaxID=1318466 RepID=U4KLE8_ALTPJ|nr:tRNA (cytidine(34)-2'-O)-methyltransferase [Alteracholeplasma palmae]CCV64638.1 Putative tRNA (cytidine/uridine-2\'-O-)-methyltransferase [Alteracholeplasma palmae J233]